MTIGALLGLICIAVGFFSAIFDEKVLFDPLAWFVAAIAFVVTLGGVTVPGLMGRRE